MSSKGSDQESLPEENEKASNQEEGKKISTKEMVNQALTDMKSRKGTSLYAIKKYIQEKYKVDVEKLNYIIKKYLKSGVEAGTIVQTKGVGATGSFKLAPKKDKAEKKKKPKPKKMNEKPATKKTEKSEKPKKSKPEKNETEKTKKKVEIAKPPAEKKEKTKKDTEKSTKEVKVKKTKTAKMAEVNRTPAKKKSAMMKRKSIGSIIKPPKMNPTQA